MNYIVYQAYGRKENINEAIFSILSYYRLQPNIDCKFIVYTDDPNTFNLKFDFLNVIVETVNEQKINLWRGDRGFVHRIKIEILLDFFSKYNGNLLYLDSDTYLIKSPDYLFEKIEQGSLFMHCCEGVISNKGNPILKKIYKFIRQNKFKIYEGRITKIPTSTEMWNAGVIGINYKSRELIFQILALTDAMYALYQKHVIEQLAVSYIFQTQQKIVSAQEYIYHYWNFKEFDLVIDKFLEENYNNDLKQMLEKMSIISPVELIKHRPKQSKFWKKLYLKIYDLFTRFF